MINFATYSFIFEFRSYSSEPRNVQEEIGQLVKKEKVVIFMKVGNL